MGLAVLLAAMHAVATVLTDVSAVHAVMLQVGANRCSFHPVSL